MQSFCLFSGGVDVDNSDYKDEFWYFCNDIIHSRLLWLKTVRKKFLKNTLYEKGKYR